MRSIWPLRACEVCQACERAHLESRLMSSVVRAEIEIDRGIDPVWQILLDLDHYSDWNPFTPRAESTLEIGAPVRLDVRLRGAKLSRRVEIVSAAEPRRLCWGMTMGAPFLLKAERCQILTPIDEHRTRYLTEDRISGLLAPLLIGLFGGAMERGFMDCASALKKRAEI
jgi:hypothetical protein